jgi:hypothetical protein
MPSKRITKPVMPIAESDSDEEMMDFLGHANEDVVDDKQRTDCAQSESDDGAESEEEAESETEEAEEAETDEVDVTDEAEVKVEVDAESEADGSEEAETDEVDVTDEPEVKPEADAEPEVLEEPEPEAPAAPEPEVLAPPVVQPAKAVRKPREPSDLSKVLELMKGHQNGKAIKMLEAFIAKNGPGGKKKRVAKAAEPDAPPKELTMHQKFMSATMLRLKETEPEQKNAQERMRRATAMWNAYKETQDGKLAVAEYQAQRAAVKAAKAVK